MRAVVHDRYGPPEVLRIEEVDRPVLAVDEVLVRVHATTVNRNDCAWRRADPARSRGRRVVFASPAFSQPYVDVLAELMESGAFRPVVDRVYPLDQAVEAARYVETERKTGNVVLTA